MLVHIVQQGYSQEGIQSPTGLDAHANLYSYTVEDMQTMKLRLSAPRGFALYMDGLGVWPDPRERFFENYGNAFISKDSTLAICIMVSPGSKKQNEITNRRMMMVRPGKTTYDADSTWIYQVRTSSDKKNGTVKYFSKELLKRLGADNGAEYLRPEKSVFKDRFYIYKTVTVHKKDVGFVSLSFFNVEKTVTDRKIDALINNITKFVHFD